MKELSIEEKAKAYDEALKVLHKYDGANIMFSQSLKEEIFPELKESKDEKWIPKEIAKYLKEKGGFRSCWLAWLEKQGEPTDIPADAVLDSNKDGLIADTIRYKIEKQDEQKIKSKFHKGDWIISSQGILRHIINVDKGGYQTDGGWLSHDTYEKAFHLWTIQDAKAGDVVTVTMYTKGTWIGIFKEHNGCTFSSYCFVDTEGTFKLGTDNHGNGIAIHPATKEQRDFLFQKMHEAGYEWDAEKKELKNIEQKSWSEEDEEISEAIIKRIGGESEALSVSLSSAISWVGNIKDRVQLQNQWKPSDEHLTQLYYASNGVRYNRAILLSLLEQLRKLREE